MTSFEINELNRLFCFVEHPPPPQSPTATPKCPDQGRILFTNMGAIYLRHFFFFLPGGRRNVCHFVQQPLAIVKSPRHYMDNNLP